jgi:hypothetical protein
VARLAHATRAPLERERGFLLIDGFAEDVRMQHTGHDATVRFVVLIPRRCVTWNRASLLDPFSL